jgi:hypothetical protein
MRIAGGTFSPGIASSLDLAMTVGRQESLDAGWSLPRTRYGAGMTGNLLLAIDFILLSMSIVYTVSYVTMLYFVPKVPLFGKEG